MKLTVLKPFLVGGVRQEAGSSIELADNLARELVWCGKAAPFNAAAPVAGPMTTATVAPVVKGRRVPSQAALVKAPAASKESDE